MTSRLFLGLMVLCCSFDSLALADNAQAEAKKETAQPTKQESAPDASTREQDFQEMLTGVTLTGTWQMTRGDATKGPVKLSPPSAESYQISKVEKAGKDHWIITARIQYADTDVEVPVMVRVVWAGDTPIITIDDLPIPMIATYSARVMVYRGYYAGTWFGVGYGGILSGQIVKKSDQKPAPAKPSGDSSKD